MDVKRCLVAVIEKAIGNSSALVPGLPGCVATGDSIPEVEAEISAAICLHLDGLREDGMPISPPSGQVHYVEAAA